MSGERDYSLNSTPQGTHKEIHSLTLTTCRVSKRSGLKQGPTDTTPFAPRIVDPLLLLPLCVAGFVVSVGFFRAVNLLFVEPRHPLLCGQNAVRT
jgi:hypothetical protein